MAETARQKKAKAAGATVLAKAALGGLNIAVAGVSTLAAAALHSGPILALGGAAYVALVAWDLASPTFWKRALAEKQASVPTARELTDPQLQEIVASLVTARRQREAALDGVSDEVKAHLAAVVPALGALDESAARLVRRADDLGQYLARVDVDGVRRELDKLADKVRRAGDAVARGKYEAALEARREHLRAVDDIAEARERAMAGLAEVVAILEGLPPKVVRMQALDAQAMDALSGSLSDEVERVNGDMRAFEETLRTLGEAHTA